MESGEGHPSIRGSAATQDEVEAANPPPPLEGDCWKRPCFGVGGMEVHAAQARWFCRDRPPCLSSRRTTTEGRTGTEACPYGEQYRRSGRTFSTTPSRGAVEKALVL